MTSLSLPITTLSFSDIALPKAKLAFVKSRADIHRLAKRILRDGLLNPIWVKKSTSGFVVVDGGKRLTAMKLLQRAGRLPRSLSKVPCVITDAPLAQTPNFGRPALKTDAELADAIMTATSHGHSAAQIASRFDCQQQTIDYALSLPRLHAQILDYFQSGHLSLEQAAAFATIENMDSQWRLLQELGPFAHAKDVIAAILAGESVVTMPDGNVMIMPSRIRPAPRPAAIRMAA